MIRIMLFSTFLIFTSCQNGEDSQDYLTNVGDISFDKNLDTNGVEPCHEDAVLQYYNFGKGIQYIGEKAALVEVFKDNYSKGNVKDEEGYIIIRFIVNCKGKTGRFRVEELNNKYESKKFQKQVVDQILSITKGLDGWLPGIYDSLDYDYYQYLTFKIVRSEIVEILP